MATITTTVGAVFLPTLWSVETLRATEAALVMAPLVKRYDAEVKAYGQVLKIPNISNIAVQTKVQNSSITPSLPTTNPETTNTINITNWFYAAFEIEDIVSVQSKYDLRSEYTSKSGYAIAKQVDSDLLSTATSFTTTAQGQYGSDIGDAVIINSMTQLNVNDIAMENRQMVIAPSQLAAIMKLDKFVKADYLGEYQMPTPVKKGPNNRYLWGTIYGMPVYYTTQVATTAATPSQTNNVMFQKEAIALALQQAPRLQVGYWLMDLAWLVVVDVIYGFSVLRTTAGVIMKS